MKKNVKTSIQSDSKKADNEIEISEAEIVPSEEITDDILVPDAEVEQDEETPEHIEETAEPDKEIKPISENTDISNKFKIKAIKRSIDNKIYSIDREVSKVAGWRIAAKDRDEKATAEYQKRKLELEALLQKNQERFDKRMLKTQKWWWDYSITYENTKIIKLNADLVLLKNELLKFELLEPQETK
jgi:hypothetical protein